jgi:hypothetical protein
VRIPYGGASLYPLQAAVCAPLGADAALAVTRRLLDAGADPNIRWRDCGGEHTPLSKALVLHSFRVGEVLAERGADCTAALLATDLLESSRFDPDLVKWLLDRGACVAPTEACSSQLEVSSRSEVTASCSGAPAPPAVGRRRREEQPPPPVAVLLRKLQRELHASGELSKLHAGAGSGQEQQLLHCAAGCLERLLAAGACPAAASPPCPPIQQAAAALLPAHWAAVREAATSPPRWSPQTHHLFPRSFHEAARAFLLAARRGFLMAGNGCTRHDTWDQALPAARGPPDTALRAGGGRVYLDDELVLLIIQLAVPCSLR